MRSLANCVDCGKQTTGRHCKRCRKCWRLVKGENHPRWKGGRIFCHGYTLVRKPEHPRARPDGYVLEHVVVMEQKLGRPLKDGEIIHHIDRNKSNNRPENLALTTNRTHMALHVKATHCRFCGKPGKIVRGLCLLHYDRWKAHGRKGENPPPDPYHGPCKVCGEKLYARGLCGKHYQQWAAGTLQGTWDISRTPKTASSYSRL